MVVKTYTREVYRIMTREELAEVLKRAHEFCKQKVPLTYHEIGQRRKRSVISHPRDKYRKCLELVIQAAVLKKVKTAYPNVDVTPIENEVKRLASEVGINVEEVMTSV